MNESNGGATWDSLRAARTEAALRGLDLGTGKRLEAVNTRRQNAEQAARQRAGSSQAATYSQKKLTAIGKTFVSLLINLLLHISPPLLVLGLVIMEIARVQAGIAMFDPDRAGGMAAVVVVGYVAVVTIRAHVAQVRGQRAAVMRMSLRRVWRWLRYALGDWRGLADDVHYLTPADRLGGVVAFNSLVIVLLGAAGSISDEISATGVAWYEAVGLQLGGTMDQLLTLVGGTVYTWAILGLLDWVLDYTYEKYLAGDTDRTEHIITEAGDLAELALIRQMIESHDRKVESKKAAGAATIPTAGLDANSADGGFSRAALIGVSAPRPAGTNGTTNGGKNTHG